MGIFRLFEFCQSCKYVLTVCFTLNFQGSGFPRDWPSFCMFIGYLCSSSTPLCLSNLWFICLLGHSFLPWSERCLFVLDTIPFTGTNASNAFSHFVIYIFTNFKMFLISRSSSFQCNQMIHLFLIWTVFLFKAFHTPRL